MPFNLHTLLVTAALVFATCNSSSGQESAKREFLRPADPQLEARLRAQHAREVAVSDYFAKSGSARVYSFDVETLKRSGEEITITPFGGPPITILSKGLSVNYDNGGEVATWIGEMNLPGSGEKVPVKWRMAIRSIDSEGNVKRPDPNREVTRSALENENYVVSRESYRRRNERIVYAFTQNTIPLPGKRGPLVIEAIGSEFENPEDFELVVVYELDPMKSIWPADDSPGHSGDSSNRESAQEIAERNREAQRRLEAFEEFLRAWEQSHGSRGEE